MEKRIGMRTVEALQPGKTIWDDRVKGFGARRQKKGISYVVKARLKGRQKYLTIGRHGSPWTPETARKEARRLLVLLEQGIDPLEEKRRERARRSTLELWEAFEKDHVEKLKESSRREYIRLFRRYVAPRMGGKALADITRDDIAALHRRMRKTPRMANLCLAVLSKFMNWA